MCLIFRLSHILVDSLLQLSSGYDNDKNLQSKLMHSHYYDLHKGDSCLHRITDGFHVFSGFDSLYK